MAALSERRARRRRKKLARVSRVAGTGVEVAEYGSGIGHSRMATSLIYLEIGFIVAFVVVPLLLGLLFPEAVLILLVPLLMRPHRGIAVTSIGIVVMRESMFDRQAEKIVYRAPPYALGPLDERLEWKRYVLVHIGPERISMKRSVYESLLVAVEHLSRAHSADSPLPIPSLPPPGWFLDPLARYQYRYWDGQSWTANISHNGVASLDSST